jgi:hypothetical protein
VLGEVLTTPHRENITILLNISQGLELGLTLWYNTSCEKLWLRIGIGGGLL